MMPLEEAAVRLRGILELMNAPVLSVEEGWDKFIYVQLARKLTQREWGLIPKFYYGHSVRYNYNFSYNILQEDEEERIYDLQ